MAQRKCVTLIHWIAIYPVDSAVHLLNNWGQVNKRGCTTDHTRSHVSLLKYTMKFFYGNLFDNSSATVTL